MFVFDWLRPALLPSKLNGSSMRPSSASVVDRVGLGLEIEVVAVGNVVSFHGHALTSFVLTNSVCWDSLKPSVRE